MHIYTVLHAYLHNSLKREYFADYIISLVVPLSFTIHFLLIFPLGWKFSKPEAADLTPSEASTSNYI